MLASGKLVVGNCYSEGSQTAKSGTDEQKLHMRLIKMGKRTHHCNALNLIVLVSRCSSDWRKEKALTRGGLGIDLVSMSQEVSRGHSITYCGIKGNKTDKKRKPSEQSYLVLSHKEAFVRRTEL